MGLRKLFSGWFGGTGSTAAEDRLVDRCRGDRELAERLINRELTRRPGLSRAKASESAVDRWNHERWSTAVDTSRPVRDTRDMRLVTVSLLLSLAGSAAAAPGWTDVPDLLARTTAPIADELRACVKGKLPKTISVILSRGTSGTTAGMPIYGLGYRGPTPEERCLGGAAAKLAFPELPAEIDQLLIGVVIVRDTTPILPPDQAFADWKDLATAVTTLIDAPMRGTLAACDGKARTVRLVVDRTSKKTRVWLPAWQFHSPTGDGTTPPKEQRVKACMTKALRGISAPALPAVLGEMQLAIKVSR